MSAIATLRDTLRATHEEGKKKKKKKGLDFSDTQVEESAETNKILMPEGMSPQEAIKQLKRWIEQQETVVEISTEIEAFPLDGAYAFASVLRDTFGWTNHVPTRSFFGDIPPKLIEIEDGPGSTVQVHWGKIQIPGVDGTLETSYAINGNRCLFRITGTVMRKHEKLVHGLAEATREYVKANSIYLGKALRINFRDEDGDIKDFSPHDCPKFIDTRTVKPEELVFPGATQELVDTTLFTPVQFTDGCLEAGIPLKRGVMLEGPYGVGKTLCANVLAKICVDNSWTFVYVEDVRDLDRALALAEMYQPCVVFGEDVDRAIGLERDSEVDRILNTLDGVAQKSTQIITVLTTNNIHGINQAMIRPGRIDTVIPVRYPDAAAAARLVMLYGRGLVTGELDEVAAALKPMLGNNAAVFREVVERGKLAAVRRLHGNIEGMTVTPEDLANAAQTMAEHIELLKERAVADERPMSLFGKAFGREVGRTMNDSSETLQIDATSKVES
jgi:transitional endoplasmic reticulum ATPase